MLKISAQFLTDGWVRVQYQDQNVANVPARALADEAPVYQRPIKESQTKICRIQK